MKDIIFVHSEVFRLNKLMKGRRLVHRLVVCRFYHTVTVFQKSDANPTKSAHRKKPASMEDVPIRVHSRVHAWENKSVKSSTISQFVSRVSQNRRVCMTDFNDCFETF